MELLGRVQDRKSVEPWFVMEEELLRRLQDIKSVSVHLNSNTELRRFVPV